MASSTSEQGEALYGQIDHIAVAVEDLEGAISYYTEALGFTLTRRLQIGNDSSGMIIAEVENNGLKFVLVQGTVPASPISQLVTNYGPGVAHVALSVSDVESTVSRLRAQGVRFDTAVIEGPGLKQVFTSRDGNSGMSFEFIQRTTERGLLEENIQELFAQLSQSEYGRPAG
jgi:methylmalonyl-CoA/ethylmalonyl-CoA epimerase